MDWLPKNRHGYFERRAHKQTLSWANMEHLHGRKLDAKSIERCRLAVEYLEYTAGDREMIEYSDLRRQYRLGLIQTRN